MAQQLELSRDLRAALAGAYGAAVGRSPKSPVVGTEHLLLGMVVGTDTGPVAQALAAAQLTRPVVMAVLRKQTSPSGGWQSDDDGDDQPPLGALGQYPPGKPTAYTGAAQAALHRATVIAAERGSAEVDNAHLLQGLLEADDSRAAELLRGCGVQPATLRDQLQGIGPVTIAEDPVPSDLRPTRDALLGKASYRSRSVRDRLASAVLRLFSANLAEMPVAWAGLDARDQARRLAAHQPGTEHLVLAILAIHETVQWYPHMQPDDADHRYAGGRVLAVAGVTYRDAHDAIRQHSDELGSDARPASSYHQRLQRYGTLVGTGQLLLEILTQNDSRGANLLRLMDVSPAEVRRRLRSALSGH